MNIEQPGPPAEVERVRRDIEWVRISQLRFLEGYRARMAEPHPMRKNARGEALNQREKKWSYADAAEAKCPGSSGRNRKAWPAHERERWTAGFLHADNLASTEGEHAMERADPSRPPPRKKREKVADPVEAFPEAIFDRSQMMEYKERVYQRIKRDEMDFTGRRPRTRLTRRPPIGCAPSCGSKPTYAMRISTCLRTRTAS